MLAGFNFYQIWLITWLWGWVTQEWVWETGQSLRHVLSFLLSPPEIYLQTALSTGFCVIPLWTVKLTSLCIIETCTTKRRMRGASFLWLWVGGWRKLVGIGGGKEKERQPLSPLGPEDEKGEKKEEDLEEIRVLSEVGGLRQPGPGGAFLDLPIEPSYTLSPLAISTEAGLRWALGTVSELIPLVYSEN